MPTWSTLRNKDSTFINNRIYWRRFLQMLLLLLLKSTMTNLYMLMFGDDGKGADAGGYKRVGWLFTLSLSHLWSEHTNCRHYPHSGILVVTCQPCIATMSPEWQYTRCNPFVIALESNVPVFLFSWIICFKPVHGNYKFHVTHLYWQSTKHVEWQ